MINKLERLLSISADRCFISKAKETVIDTLHPETGLTMCYGRTLAETREEYPDAEEMDIADFCAWKAERQRTPIMWDTTTEETYYHMLDVLPPAAHLPSAFLVGEPYDHDAGNGLPRYRAYRFRGDRYEVSNRPMTRPEFLREVKP